MVDATEALGPFRCNSRAVQIKRACPDGILCHTECDSPYQFLARDDARLQLIGVVRGNAVAPRHSRLLTADIGDFTQLERLSVDGPSRGRFGIGDDLDEFVGKSLRNVVE